MSYIPEPIEKLARQLSRLPGLGIKTAYRIAFYIVDSGAVNTQELTETLNEAKKRIRLCDRCYGYAVDGCCYICSDRTRDKHSICVVERPHDVFIMERSAFKGEYHVLHGVISPLDGVGPFDIKLQELFDRMKKDLVKELIIALDPNVEGDATTIYIANTASKMGVKVSRLARGVPAGASIDYIDDTTLSRAIEERQEVLC